jgi:hypothetical protein
MFARKIKPLDGVALAIVMAYATVPAHAQTPAEPVPQPRTWQQLVTMDRDIEFTAREIDLSKAKRDLAKINEESNPAPAPIVTQLPPGYGKGFASASASVAPIETRSSTPIDAGLHLRAVYGQGSSLAVVFRRDNGTFKTISIGDSIDDFRLISATADRAVLERMDKARRRYSVEIDGPAEDAASMGGEGIVLYQAGIAGLKRLQAANGVLPHIGPVKGSGSSGGPKERPQDLSTMPTGRDPARAEVQALEVAQLQQARPLDVDAQLAEYDPIAEMAGLDSAVVRKSKNEVFVDDSLEPFDALATDSVAPEGGAEETVRQQAAARPVDADEDTEVLTPAAMGDDFEIPPRAPVELSDLAEQQLARVTSLSNTVVPDSAVDLLGPQVVGLKDNSINGIEVVARAMGASPEQAHNDALAAQRGVATAYTPPPPAGGDPTETDVDQLFSVVIEHMEENSGGTAR